MDKGTSITDHKTYRIGMFVCLVVVFVFAFMAFSEAALAQFGLDSTVQQTDLKNAPGSVPVIIGKLVSATLRIVGVAFLLLMLYGGFLWMTARGNTETAEKAKNTITSAIIGIIIVSSAYAVTSFIVERITTDAPTSSEAGTPEQCRELAPRSCQTGDDCLVEPNLGCYVGTCECVLESDPDIGSPSNPCSSTTEGFCRTI